MKTRGLSILGYNREIERLQATVEHLQDQCKEEHDSMIAMMNEALRLRGTLEQISKRARQKWSEGKHDGWLWVYKTADEALRDD